MFKTPFMKCFACYNNDVELWRNKRENILSEDPPLRCHVFAIDGHLIYKRDVLARCADQQQAEMILEQAGFSLVERSPIVDNFDPENNSVSEWQA